MNSEENKKYTINLDHGLKLIRYRHSGLIYAEDIEKAWSEFLSFQEFTVLKDWHGANG